MQHYFLLEVYVFSNHLLPSIKDEDKSCMAVLHVFESFCCVSVSLCRFPVGLSFFFMLRAPVIKTKIFWKTNGRFPSVEMTSLREWCFNIKRTLISRYPPASLKLRINLDKPLCVTKRTLL